MFNPSGASFDVPTGTKQDHPNAHMIMSEGSAAAPCALGGVAPHVENSFLRIVQ
jgi:hypothetical protein